MSNQIAIIFGVSLLIVIGHDFFFNDAANLIFLARKGLDLINVMRLWR